MNVVIGFGPLQIAALIGTVRIAVESLAPLVIHRGNILTVPYLSKQSVSNPYEKIRYTIN